MITTSESQYGLTIGTPTIRSVGPLAFGCDRILFVADNTSAAIFAIDVGEGQPASETRPIDVEDLDTRLAAYLGCRREDVFIRDVAVHPRSHQVFLSMMRGGGSAAVPVLLTIGADGTLTEVPLVQVPFAQTTIADAPPQNDARLDARLVQGTREGELMEPRQGWKLQVARDPLRTVTVTDLAYVDGILLVAGVSNEEFSSTLRRIRFPFNGTTASNGLEIFHVSHGKYETASPIRTFVPFGRASILASYTCTPVVHFSLEDVEGGTQIKGRTVAELGAGNTPLDMVAYAHDGEACLLVSNVRHPLMKLKQRDVETQEGLTQPREPVGVPREMLPQPGVSRMANLNDRYIVMLQMDEGERYHLRSYSTAEL